MRYRLRTLFVLIALGPPILAWVGWPVFRRLIEHSVHGVDEAVGVVSFVEDTDDWTDPGVPVR